MIGLYSLIIAAGVVFSTFAVTTFNGFSDFQSKTSQLIDYDTTALASSTRIAKESSKFLNELKLSLNGESLEESPSVLLDDLISDLKPHSDNQLSKTIAYGLNGKQDYKVELVNSGYIPAKLKSSDISYASVILTLQGNDDDVATQSKCNLKQFKHDAKLKISEQLLSKLFSEKKLEEIKAKQAKLGLQIAAEGLKLKDLPNGLKFALNKDAVIPPPAIIPGANIDSAISQDEKYMTRTAVAQIRVGEVDEVISVSTTTPPVVVDPPIVVDLPIVQPSVTSDPLVDVRRLELALEVSPLSNRGFLFDPSSTINGSNPLQIINKKEGGYSSIFVRDDGYLQIAIGSISKKLGNKTKNIEFFEDKTLKFNAAVLTFEDTEVPEGKEVIYSKDKKITMAIDAKGRTSYTTVKQAFTLGNGVTVPAGSVIASIKETGIHEWHAEIGEYEHFRAYDPVTGSLLTSFGQKGLKSAGCNGSKKCFDVKQFVAEEGTGFNGQKIFYSFSTQDLGLGSDPYSSALAWVNIQLDLNEKIVSDLNAKKVKWQAEELKKLNNLQIHYTGIPEIDKLNESNIGELRKVRYSGDLNALRAFFGVSSPDYSKFDITKVVTLRNLETFKLTALADFALTKGELWELKKGAKDTKEYKENKEDTIEDIKNTRAVYLEKLDNYEKYLKKHGNAEKNTESEIEEKTSVNIEPKEEPSVSKPKKKGKKKPKKKKKNGGKKKKKKKKGKK